MEQHSITNTAPLTRTFRGRAYMPVPRGLATFTKGEVDRIRKRVFRYASDLVSRADVNINSIAKGVLAQDSEFLRQEKYKRWREPEITRFRSTVRMVAEEAFFHQIGRNGHNLLSAFVDLSLVE
eukprot:Colp12_sorted_trinity150504_noHs@8395